MQPTRGYTGDVLRKVLLVNAHTGDITQYDPQNVPTWVDRVMPADTVNQYLTWWGLYHAAPWFNPSGAGQQQPASSGPQLVYNNADQPVWLVPMTSNATSDNSSTGVFLFDTHKNQAVFYTAAAGLGIGDNVLEHLCFDARQHPALQCGQFPALPDLLHSYLGGHLQQ